MNLDLSKKTDAQIDELIKNYERNNAQSHEIYTRILEERARRAQDKGLLDFSKSMELLIEAAKRQKCVSYGQIAEASGVEWRVARLRMNGPKGHLDRILDLCHARRLPMLPAICVNKPNLQTGELDPAALSGFINGARRLGHFVSDEHLFHRERQKECWEWGRQQDA